MLHICLANMLNVMSFFYHSTTLHLTCPPDIRTNCDVNQLQYGLSVCFTHSMVSMVQLCNKKCSEAGPKRCSSPEQYQYQFWYYHYTLSFTPVHSSQPATAWICKVGQLSNRHDQSSHGWMARVLGKPSSWCCHWILTKRAAPERLDVWRFSPGL